MNINVLGPQM
jgi:hypothetical protein